MAAHHGELQPLLPSEARVRLGRRFLAVFGFAQRLTMWPFSNTGSPSQEEVEATFGRLWAAQLETVRDVALRQNGWLKFCVCFLIVITVAMFAYLETASVYILLFHSQPYCNMPTENWLLGRVSVVLLSTYFGGHLVPIFWVAVGYHLSSSTLTCPGMSPELSRWTQRIVHWDSLWIIFVLIAHLCMGSLVLLVVFFINCGLIRNGKAGRKSTIKLLEHVAYRPGLFAEDPPVAGDLRPSAECCCCAETMAGPGGGAIVRTPCGHFFHRSCLGGWLRLKSTCPLCRCDLNEATEHIA